MASAPILEVRDLRVDYETSRGPVHAVAGVDIDVQPGEFLGIVGESGCGKSTMLFAIAQLLNAPARVAGGQVLFQGRDLVALDDRALAPLRWRGFSVVMQSAMNALNPVRTIGAQFADVLKVHHVEDPDRGAEVLRMVGIDPVHLKSHPHQLSGGMRQRAMIAMALLLTPDLILMDEPTSALDVVAQRQLMMQIRTLQQELGFAVMFVTHDMSLVSRFSDRLMVMYAGQVVEIGPTRDVFDRPTHPYSRGLLEALPSLRGPRVPLTGIPGSPPDLGLTHAGCPFSDRCPRVFAACLDTPPPLIPVGDVLTRCLLYDTATVEVR